jgi:1-deoxy-D-xylulose-5-phosphate synthase
VLPLGRGRVVRQGERVALLSLGTRLWDALAAAELLGRQGIGVTVADARFAKPLDGELVERLARHHEVLITIEEGSVGGFGSAVLQHLSWAGLLDGGVRVRPMVLPDRFIDQDSQPNQLAAAGLDAHHIAMVARQVMGLAAAAA